MPLTKTPSESPVDQLVGYLTGESKMCAGYFSLAQLWEALGKLLNYPQVSEESVVSRVKKAALVGCRFAEMHLVRKALKATEDGEKLYFSLMGVRQAREFQKARRPRRRR